MKNPNTQKAVRKFLCCANVKNARQTVMRRAFLNIRTDIKNGIVPKAEELENLCAVYELLEELEPYQNNQ